MNKSVNKLFYGIILYPVYLISKLIPTSNQVWVFGAWYGKLFTDNTSYIYEYIKEKKPIFPVAPTIRCAPVTEVRRKRIVSLYTLFS